MLDAGEVELAIIWEPDTSAARARGYTVALSSADVPDSIVDVIVASNHLIDRDPTALAALLRAYYARMDGFAANPAAFERFIAEDGALPPEGAKSVIAGIKVYGTADADEYMNAPLFPLDRPKIEQSLDGIGAVLALSHPGIDLDAAKIDGSYLRRLRQGTPNG
jgi:OmpA-OmpF porin, OOP family